MYIVLFCVTPVKCSEMTLVVLAGPYGVPGIGLRLSTRVQGKASTLLTVPLIWLWDSVFNNLLLLRFINKIVTYK